MVLALSHKTRVLIALLLSERERSAGELSAILGISSPLTSQHLRLLKRADLISQRRIGKQIFYNFRTGIHAALSSLLAASEFA